LSMMEHFTEALIINKGDSGLKIPKNEVISI